MGQKFDTMCNFTKDVKRSAVGRWDVICSTLLPETADAISLGGRKHITCPYHQGKNDFRVSKDFANDGKLFCTCFEAHTTNVISLIMEKRYWDFPTTIQNIAEVLGNSYRQSDYTPKTVVRAKPVIDETPSDQEIMDRNTKYWAASLSLTDPDAALARKYLAARGLTNVGDLPHVRFIESLPYFNEESQSFDRYPALLSVISQANGQVATLHRTYLAPNGESKANVDNPRKEFSTPTCCPSKGGAIRIDQAKSPVLLVAEGLETALSARAISGYPVWSTVNARMLENLEVPDYVKVVAIFADRDRSLTGQNAGMELCKRLRAKGLQAMIFLPPFSIPDDKKGIDWNDVVLHLGVKDAANHFTVQRWKRSVDDLLISKQHTVHEGLEACYSQ